MLSRKHWTIGVVAFVASLGSLLVLSGQGSNAQPAAAGNAPVAKPETLTKLYYIREFTEPIQNYPIKRSGAEVNPPCSNGDGNLQRAKSHEEIVDDLIKIIENLVHPDTWKDCGGTIGAISEHNGLLIVTTSADIHKELAKFLDRLRHAMRIDASIEIDAQWILVSTEQVLKWQAGDPVQADVLKDPKSIQCCARVTARDGQTVSVAGGKLGIEVTGAQPVVANAAAALAFECTPTRIGTTLEVTPRISDDRGSLLVEVISIATESVPDSPRARPTTRIGGDIDMMYGLEKPPRQDQHLSETVRLPIGTAKFVGGMTIDPGKGDSKHLCLILTGAVVDSVGDKALAAVGADPRQKTGAVEK